MIFVIFPNELKVQMDFIFNIFSIYLE